MLLEAEVFRFDGFRTLFALSLTLTCSVAYSSVMTGRAFSAMCAKIVLVVITLCASGSQLR